MVRKPFFGHLVQQAVWKIFEHLSGRFRAIIFPIKLSVLAINPDVRQRVQTIIVHHIVKSLKTLANTKDRPVDSVIIFLLFAVLKNFL